MEEKCERIVSFLAAKLKEEEKEGQKERTTLQDNTSLGQAGKFVILPSACGTKLAVCRCSRRIAEKDGDDGKVAESRSASEREQMGGEDYGRKEKTELKWKKRQSC